MQKLSRRNKGYIGMVLKQVTEQTVPEVSDKLYGQRLDQKTPPPKMSSRGSCATQQETSSIQKRLFTGVNRRRVCGHTRSSSSGGHVSIQ